MKNFFVQDIDTHQSVVIDRPNPRDPEYQITRQQLIDNRDKANFLFDKLFKKLIVAREDRNEKMSLFGIDPKKYDIPKLLMHLKISNNDLFDPDEEIKLMKMLDGQ